MLQSTLTSQLEAIDRRLDGIDRKIDGKATNERVIRLEQDLALAVRRIGDLELSRAGVAAVTTFQRWVIGTVGIGCLGSIATLVWLASGGH